MSEVIPLGASVDTLWLSVPVTAAHDGSGDAVANSTDSIDVLVRNIGDWPVEVKVDSGEWTVLNQRNSKFFDISMATSTVRLRKGQIAATGLVRLEISSLQGTYVADGEAVDLGGGAGAAAFTDLTDAPASVVPNAMVCGNNAGTGLLFQGTLAAFLTAARSEGRWFQASREVTEDMDMSGWDRTVFAVPIALPDPDGRSMELGVEITIPPDVAVSAKMGIYADDNGLPGARVSVSAAFTLDPAAVEAHVAVTAPTAGGAYWLAFNMDTPGGTTPSLRGIVGSSLSDNRRYLGQETSPAGYGYVCVQNVGTVSFPDAIPTTLAAPSLTRSTGTGDPECPMMFYRYVSP